MLFANNFVQRSRQYVRDATNHATTNVDNKYVVDRVICVGQEEVEVVCAGRVFEVYRRVCPYHYPNQVAHYCHAKESTNHQVK